MKIQAGLLTAIGLLYSQLAEKGVMAIIRIRKTPAGWKAQSVIDWDCDDYEALVDQAGKIKAYKVRRKSQSNDSTEVENTDG